MTLGAESFGFGNVVFILVFFGAIGAFFLSARRLIEMFRLGKADGRLDNIRSGSRTPSRSRSRRRRSCVSRSRV